METLIKVTAKLLHKENYTPYTGGHFLVKLFDKDLFRDDELGQASPDTTGSIEIIFPRKKMRSLDSPLESRPELYFIFYQHNKALYQCPVVHDLGFVTVGSFGEQGVHYDLGTFLI